MKKKIVLWALLIGVLAAGGSYYYVYHYGAKYADPLKSKDKIYIKAVDLFTLYNTHEDSANRLYLDSVISVSGKLQNIQLDEGRYTLTLESGDSSGAVVCEMDLTDNEKIKALKTGIEISIDGLCSGLLMDVQLRRCKLED